MKIKYGNFFYWPFYVYYLYIIAPSALSKVFQREKMMQSMASLGFNTTWTIAIGIAETIGIALVLAGLWKSALRTTGILFLFPFAIGAFTTHMAHQEYHHYFNSLIMCILSTVLLLLDKRISIDLRNGKYSQ